VWGYDETQPIADVTNAPCTQVFYTSFEPRSAGGWAYDSIGTLQPGGRTGRWSLLLGLGGAPSVTASALPAGRYELSFWTNTAPAQVAGNSTSTLALVRSLPSGWQCYRGVFQVGSANGTIRLEAPANSTTRLDELRLHPVGAQMTSYTYDPLVGMTSQTDPTGRTTTYEYDALGRLLHVRDEQGRLVKANEYHYARP
jgi:YD repeat-containing protein